MTIYLVLSGPHTSELTVVFATASPSKAKERALAASKEDGHAEVLSVVLEGEPENVFVAEEGNEIPPFLPGSGHWSHAIRDTGVRRTLRMRMVLSGSFELDPELRTP